MATLRLQILNCGGISPDHVRRFAVANVAADLAMVVAIWASLAMDVTLPAGSAPPATASLAGYASSPGKP